MRKISKFIGRFGHACDQKQKRTEVVFCRRPRMGSASCGSMAGASSPGKCEILYPEVWVVLEECTTMEVHPYK